MDDYPECLKEFLGRKIWRDTINSIAADEKKWSAGWFVKPVESKVFTGKVISSIKDLIGCGAYIDNFEVLYSEPIEFVREWRCFVYYDEIIDVLQNTLDSLFKQKGIDLRNNEKLLVSLGLHLTPALDRLLDDSQIENPLTAKIKERHPKEFAMAEILNDAIESIYHKRFTEDEVAYFALHFIVSARQK